MVRVAVPVAVLQAPPTGLQTPMVTGPPAGLAVGLNGSSGSAGLPGWRTLKMPRRPTSLATTTCSGSAWEGNQAQPLTAGADSHDRGDHGLQDDAGNLTIRRSAGTRRAFR